MGALTIAGHFKIPEVTLYFNNRLFRGNRVRKVDTNVFESFNSPNFPPLAKLNVNIEIQWDLILTPHEGDLSVFTNLSENISTLRI